MGPRHTCWGVLGSRVGVQGRAGWGLGLEVDASPATWACFCRDTNMRFSTELRRLQSLPKCERLPLPSFLLLPFQRITRLRMLLQVLSWCGAFPAPPASLENSSQGPLPGHHHFPLYGKHRLPLNQDSWAFQTRTHQVPPGAAQMSQGVV